jgi:formylglycine-generating enzyme required for sulfatase activity
LALGVALALPPGAAAADGIMLIQAGAFWMGSDSDDPNEAPIHRVYVRDFWIDRHKVNNTEFAQFLNARGARSPEGEDYFDWDDADVRIHGLIRGGPGRGPARGEDKRRYPWGDAAPTSARAIHGRAYNATVPVDVTTPEGASPYRVQDMLGNAREWTASEYRTYPYVAGDGRESAGRFASRVVRGASHDDPVETLRVTLRRFYEHRGVARGHHFIGFRCATSEDLGEMAK